jgi:hypothetical protein
VQKILSNIHSICSNTQFALSLAAKENEHFGKITSERESGIPVKGRPLWLFNEGVKGKKTHTSILDYIFSCIYKAK